jgi:peroxiredoxin Q/BCP
MSHMPDKLMGKMAPQFCLPDADDVETCLDQFPGKWIILYFYPRDNSPGCTMEANQFNQERENFRKNDAVIIGISPDTVESHRKFRERRGLQFLLLSDTEQSVLTSYGVWKPKVLFGKELLGVERSTFLIDPEGIIVEVWRKVRVPGHVAAVLSALETHRKEKIPA